MRLGKLSNKQLEELLLCKFDSRRPEVFVRPGIGLDCAAVDLGRDLCVMSTDPITGAAKNIGSLAVHICCNDAAAAGAQPVGIMITLLLPAYADDELISAIADDIADASRIIGIEVIGGHTEVTDAVTRPVISATVLARAEKNGLISATGLSPGDDIILTKWAGLEGCAIIADDFSDKIDGVLSSGQLQEVSDWKRLLSVVKEGTIASQTGATAMHDVTEGGVLGASWEMATAAGCGIELWCDCIPVRNESRLICEHLGMDALKLISSGCMLIGCQDAKKMLSALEAHGIPSSHIGRAVVEGITCDGIGVAPPEADELLKLFD